MSGWIKLHRSICENPYWLEEPFTRGQAWVDLLLLANSKPGHVRKQGMKIVLERGDVGASENILSSRWMWSRGKVRRFLQDLEEDGMIARKHSSEKDKRTFVITVLNYSKFQDKSTLNGTSESTTNGQAPGQATVQEQEVKKERKKENYSERFLEFWKEYPKHDAKAKAYESFQKKGCGGDLFDVIMDALIVQKNSVNWKKDDGQFIPYAATWINQKRWEDEGPKESVINRCSECDYNVRLNYCKDKTDAERAKCTVFRVAV